MRLNLYNLKLYVHLNIYDYTLKMRQNYKLLYISETNFPNDAANSIATLKMCSSFSKFAQTDLYTLSCQDNYDKLKKDFLLTNKFKIISFFKKSKRISLIIRLIIFFKILKRINNKKYNYIFTRSVLISVLLSLLGHKNILEFHHPNTGITKYIFSIYQKFFKNKNQRFILITKNINKNLKIPKKKFIVLDTCIDLKNFKFKTKIKRNSCVYTGSLFKGKGFEIIYELAKLLKNIDFYIYGKKDFLDKKNYNFNLKNLKIFPYQKYKNIPKIINSHKICLMPYSKKVHIRSSSISVENYMSPIKLFEYLACKKVVIASRMQVYSHILKDGFNCYLLNSENIDSWAKKINYVINNYDKIKKIRENAFSTSKKFDSQDRAKKILLFYENFLNEENKNIR